MAALSLMLVTVVRSRIDNRTDVIFGGAEGAYVRSDSVSFADPKGIATPEPTEDIWPKINIELPQYYLVNDAHPIASPHYAPEDISVIEGTGYMMFDTATKPYLEAMLQDMRDHGFNVYVAGAYRDYTYQKYLFDGKASQIALGMGLEGDEIWLDPRYQEAVEEARSLPGIGYVRVWLNEGELARHQRASAGPGSGPDGQALFQDGLREHEPGVLQVSGLHLRQIRLHQALSHQKAASDRLGRALALPLCGRGGRYLHHGAGPVLRGILCPLRSRF